MVPTAPCGYRLRGPMKEKHIRIRIEQCLALATASNCPRRKFGALLLDPERNVVHTPDSPHPARCFPVFPDVEPLSRAAPADGEAVPAVFLGVARLTHCAHDELGRSREVAGHQLSHVQPAHLVLQRHRTL